MDIQPIAYRDLHKVLDLQPPGWDIMPSIEFYTQHDYCFPIKLTRDQKIIGIGTTIIHNDVAWLAHIIVHPDYRNQGIGIFITQKLVDRVRAENCDTVYLLATELGEPVYKKTGFEVETEYLSFKGTIESGVTVDMKNIFPNAGDFQKQIAQLDQQVSGEDRMFHLKSYLPSGYVYVQENEVMGYYLPTLGDGLIIATGDEAGFELMKLRLQSKDFAVFPGDNKNAIAFMQKLGFEEFRTQKRMRLGNQRHWEPTGIYNRIGGNLG